MSGFFKRLGTWCLQSSLWIVALGLMLASSGIDGTYMERLNAWPSFGYILNFMSDVANLILMYWYGRLQQDRSPKKQERSRHVLKAEWVAIGYSWLFSWRQLRPQVYNVETMPVLSKLFGAGETGSAWEVEVLALVFAGFIPLILAFIGYVQSLLAGRLEDEQKVSAKATQEVTSGRSNTQRTPIDDEHDQPYSARSAHRATAQDDLARSVGTQDAKDRPVVSVLSPEERRAQALALWSQDPMLTQESMAQALGVSRQTVSRDFAHMSADGIVKKNGNGVEVLPSKD
jgi:hypothetical protein